jgi:hypothetical protein
LRDSPAITNWFATYCNVVQWLSDALSHLGNGEPVGEALTVLVKAFILESQSGLSPHELGETRWRTMIYMARIFHANGEHFMAWFLRRQLLQETVGFPIYVAMLGEAAWSLFDLFGGVFRQFAITWMEADIASLIAIGDSMRSHAVSHRKKILDFIKAVHEEESRVMSEFGVRTGVGGEKIYFHTDGGRDLACQDLHHGYRPPPGSSLGDYGIAVENQTEVLQSDVFFFVLNHEMLRL